MSKSQKSRGSPRPQVSGLISWFATCIEAYSFVMAGREFHRDYELECADLSVDKLRLLLWGEAVGLAWRTPQTGIDCSSMELLSGGVDPYAKYTLVEVPKILKDISIVLARSRTVFDERSGTQTNLSRPTLQPHASSKSDLRGLSLFQESFIQFQTFDHPTITRNYTTALKIASQNRNAYSGVCGLGRLIGFLEHTTKNYVFPETLAHVLEKEVMKISNLQDLLLLSLLSGSKHNRTSRAARARISLLQPSVVTLQAARLDEITADKAPAESLSSNLSLTNAGLILPAGSLSPSANSKTSESTTTVEESTRISTSPAIRDSYVTVRASAMIEAELSMLTWSDSICTTLRGQSIHESELEFEDPSSEAFRVGFLRRFAAARAAIPALTRVRRQRVELTAPLPPLPPPTRQYTYHSQMLLHKIVMFGDGGVGKTDLTIKLCQDPYDLSYDPTMEDSFYKQAQIDDTPCVMEVIDIAGQEEYTSLSDQFIREGDGFLLVYSIYDRTSFTSITKYQHQIVKTKGRDCAELPIVLVAHEFSGETKDPNRQVSTEEGSYLAKSIGCKFVEASAKTGEGVEDAFYRVVRTIRTQQLEWSIVYPKS